MVDYTKTPTERPWAKELALGDYVTPDQAACVDGTRLMDFGIFSLLTPRSLRRRCLQRHRSRLELYADDAAAYLKNSARPTPEGEQLRDFLDAWTQGDLDCIKLDILTDMVTARLRVCD